MVALIQNDIEKIEPLIMLIKVDNISLLFNFTQIASHALLCIHFTFCFPPRDLQCLIIRSCFDY